MTLALAPPPLGEWKPSPGQNPAANGTKPAGKGGQRREAVRPRGAGRPALIRGDSGSILRVGRANARRLFVVKFVSSNVHFREDFCQLVGGREGNRSHKGHMRSPRLVSQEKEPRSPSKMMLFSVAGPEKNSPGLCGASIHPSIIQNGD